MDDLNKNLKVIKLKTSDKPNSSKFMLKLNNKEIGYSYIFPNNDSNKIYIFINEDMRSNGFGSKTFEQLVKLLKQSNLDHLIFNIEKSNICANNIIAKFGGKLLSEDNCKNWLLKI